MLVIRCCMASDTEWDLFRTFEAVARTGSLTAAGKALGVSQSTVSRQLAALELRAGSPLVLRETPLRLTDRGAALLVAVQPMVDAALSAGAALDHTAELRGELTLTTVGEVVRWVLVKRVAAFHRSYPHLRLRILASNDVTSLAAGDADVALRMFRPAKGDLVARKLMTETFGLYAHPSIELGPDVPWLGLTGSLSRIPEQRYAETAFASRPAQLLVEDVESLGLAVQAGVGVAVLPRRFAATLAVAEVSAAEVGARAVGRPPSRDLWMVVHRNKHKLPGVRAVMDWVRAAFGDGVE